MATQQLTSYHPLTNKEAKTKDTYVQTCLLRQASWLSKYCCCVNKPCARAVFISSHLSLNRKGRWGTADDFTTNFLHFSLFSTDLLAILGLGQLQACPFPDVVFPPLFLCALSFFPLSLCLVIWSWPDLMNGRHDHTTAY